MIELKNISFSYANNCEDSQLRHIDLTVKKGELIILAGKSGCGKTTLTRVLNGLCPQFYPGNLTGSYSLDGQDALKIPIHQCANSAAMMEMPETSLTISRAGISMYGLYPSEEMDKDNMKLIPAMSIYSHVVYVKNIEKGRGVSYGQTFVADKPMTIATIPVGYGDGYPRNLSNKGYVLINGKKCNILGRVCMDQFMVDVTGMDVKEGDKVTLAGKDGSEEILIDDLAALAGTFNYEFVCDLGKRVPRVFVKDGKIVGTKDYFEDDYEVEI
mgnify:CR=1 FL=1